MIVTIYSTDSPYKGKTVEVTTDVSAFYGTGSPIKKVDKITVRFILTDRADISPVVVKGTRFEFEELVHKLQEKIRLNKKVAGLDWEKSLHKQRNIKAED